MDFTKFLSQAFEYASWFLYSIDDRISGAIFGGWTAVIGFAIVVVFLFLVTRLLNPGRFED
jgi:Fe2+ transport system protein B